MMIKITIDTFVNLFGRPFGSTLRPALSYVVFSAWPPVEVQKPGDKYLLHYHSTYFFIYVLCNTRQVSYTLLLLVTFERTMVGALKLVHLNTLSMLNDISKGSF